MLPLLQTKGVTWIEVFSARIVGTIFFCEDENTKAVPEEAGAEPWSIYTKAELDQRVKQNRIAPISSAELCKLHSIKYRFSGRIS